MMRHLLSDQMGDFAAVYDEDVELISVARPGSDSLATLAEQLFTSNQVVQVRWEQAAGDPDAPISALPVSMDPQ